MADDPANAQNNPANAQANVLDCWILPVVKFVKPKLLSQHAKVDSKQHKPSHVTERRRPFRFNHDNIAPAIQNMVIAPMLRTFHQTVDEMNDVFVAWDRWNQKCRCLDWRTAINLASIGTAGSVNLKDQIKKLTEVRNTRRDAYRVNQTPQNEKRLAQAKAALKEVRRNARLGNFSDQDAILTGSIIDLENDEDAVKANLIANRVEAHRPNSITKEEADAFFKGMTQGLNLHVWDDDEIDALQKMVELVIILVLRHAAYISWQANHSTIKVGHIQEVVNIRNLSLDCGDIGFGVYPSRDVNIIFPVNASQGLVVMASNDDGESRQSEPADIDGFGSEVDDSNASSVGPSELSVSSSASSFSSSTSHSHGDIDEIDESDESNEESDENVMDGLMPAAPRPAFAREDVLDVLRTKHLSPQHARTLQGYLNFA